MDQHQYQPYQQQPYQPNPYFNPEEAKRNPAMAVAALVLGCVSIVLCTCLYISIPCGALAILFALLSRGGSLRMNGQACAGLGLGIAGLVLTIVVYAASLFTTTVLYGSYTNFIESMQQYDMNDPEDVRKLYEDINERMNDTLGISSTPSMQSQSTQGSDS